MVLVLQAGALLACGIVNSGVRNECDPALALLSDYVSHNTSMMRIGAIVGYVVNLYLFGRMILPLCMCFKYFILCLIYDQCRLGLAYAGSNREDVLALILPVLGESKANMEVQLSILSVLILITLTV